MKTAIFSDTHGTTSLMCEAVRRCRPDVIIHLGDYERDTAVLRREFPDIPLYNVCGNCDIAVTAPVTDTLWLDGVKVFLTHGHMQNVKWGIDSLIYAAMEQGCRVALYGHTHVDDICEIAGVTAINPGTAGHGRRLTWALLTTFENGTFTAEIKEL